MVQDSGRAQNSGDVTAFQSYILSDLRARLISEHIKPGDRLPSIPKLQKQYDAGRSTIRAILRRLASEGLITLAERRTAVASDCTHDTEWRTSWRSRVLQNRYNVLSTHFAAAFMLPPLAAFAAQHIEELPVPELRYVSGVTRGVESVLSGSGGIVAKLVPVFLEHSAIPYFWEVSSEYRDAARSVLSVIMSGSRKQNAVAQSIGAAVSEVRRIVRTLADKTTSLPEPLPAHCSLILFPEIEQRYQHIALDLLVRIGIGGWGPVGLLPSEQHLAKHYSASVSTIREALSRLDEAGFTHTVNGRGTFAGEKREPRSGVLTPWLEATLTRALKASQLLALVMPVCAREAVKRCTTEDVRKLDQIVSCNPSGLPIRALFRFIVHRQVLPPVRIVLARAGMACDWGLAIAMAADRPVARSILEDKARTLVECLRTGRTVDFVTGISKLYLERLIAERDALADQRSGTAACSISVPDDILL